VHAILCRQRFLQRSMALSFGHTGPLLPATPAGPCDAAAGRPAPAPSQAATRSKASKLVGGFVQPAARGALLRPAAAYLCKPLEAVGVCAQAERVPAKVARQRAVQVRGRVGAPAARVPTLRGGGTRPALCMMLGAVAQPVRSTATSAAGAGSAYARLWRAAGLLREPGQGSIGLAVAHGARAERGRARQPQRPSGLRHNRRAGRAPRAGRAREGSCSRAAAEDRARHSGHLDLGRRYECVRLRSKLLVAKSEGAGRTPAACQIRDLLASR